MNLAERALVGGLNNPLTSCPVYTAAMGTAVVFSAGLAVTYSGYGLYNPVAAAGTSAIKLVPVNVSIIPTNLSTAANYFAIAKYIGTGTAFAGGASTGGVTQQNLAGTTTLQRATVFGTGSMAIAPIYVKFLTAFGTGGGNPAPNLFPLDGDLTVMPGEGLIFVQGIAGTALCSITWAEVPV